MRNIVSTIMLFAVIASSAPALAQSQATKREAFQCVVQNANNTRWQNIHWQPDMETAKAAARREQKAILVVMHNNFGGDVHSHDC